MRDWSTADLDDEARDHILDEAGKLFGGGRGQFKNLLGRRGGGTNRGGNDQPKDAPKDAPKSP